ncbi:hypothetical protein CSA37_12515 [Candidatus Fermentibacteria bacterium]|nr:MAG: hypothetical protein CSA37_12515 [Candidatus Fermentibacteria bacterium]
MWHTAVIAVMGSLLSGALISQGANEPVTPDIITSASVYVEAQNTVSQEDIDSMLNLLESEEPPETVPGTMRAVVLPAPSEAEYECPVCGEKTLHGSDYAFFLEKDLEDARELVKCMEESTEFSIVLDETLFCQFCSEERAEEPGLVLQVSYEDGTQVINRVSMNDLRKLLSFLQGHLYWYTADDAQEPLQEHSELLRTLLGR